MKRLSQVRLHLACIRSTRSFGNIIFDSFPQFYIFTMGMCEIKIAHIFANTAGTQNKNNA